jgi:hypothetical protein
VKSHPPAISKRWVRLWVLIGYRSDYRAESSYQIKIGAEGRIVTQPVTPAAMEGQLSAAGLWKVGSRRRKMIQSLHPFGLHSSLRSER